MNNPPPDKPSQAFIRSMNALKIRETTINNTPIIDPKILKELSLPGLFDADVISKLSSNSSQLTDKIYSAIISLSQLVRKDFDKNVYRINDEIRREIIKQSNFKDFRDLLNEHTPRPLDHFERLFRDSISSGAIPDGSLEEFGIELVSRVANILRPSLLSINSDFSLQRKWRILQQKRTFERAANAVFVNRETEFARFSAFVKDSNDKSARVLEIQGAAGTGKTTLAKRFLNSFLTDQHYPIIHIDFERPISNQNLLATLCRETLNTFTDFNVCNESFYASVSQEIDSIIDTLDAVAILQLIFDLQPHGIKQSVLFFLDSIELFANEHGDVQNFLSILEVIVRDFGFCKIITATRQSILNFSVQVERIFLQDLTERDIARLCKMNGLDIVRAGFVQRLLPARNPLLATLIIELVRNERRFLLDDVSATKNAQQFLFQKYVIDRIIAKMSLPMSREVAIASIPLRRISEEMLYNSDIFPTIQPFIETRPGAIFEQIRTQIIFFETHDSDLYLRMDIRALLINLSTEGIDQERRQQTRQATLRYLLAKPSEKRTFSDLVDVIYYLLVLARPREELEEHWHPRARAELLKYFDELPPRSRCWLKRKIGRRWVKADFSEAFDEDAREELIAFAQHAIYAGSSDDLEEVLRSWKIGPTEEISGEFALARGLLHFVRRDWNTTITCLHRAIGFSRSRDAIEIATLFAIRANLLSGEQDTKGPADSRVLDIIDRFRGFATVRSDPAFLISFVLVGLWSLRGNLQYWLDGESQIFSANSALDIVVNAANELPASKLDYDAFTEVCLLGSLYNPLFVTAWIKFTRLRRTNTSDAQYVVTMLRNKDFDRDKDLSTVAHPQSWDAMDDGILGDTAKTLPRAELRKLLDRLAERLEITYQFSDREVLEMREIMARASGTFTALLVEQLIEWFPILNPKDVAEARKVFGRPISSNLGTRGVIASAVRRFRSEGQLFSLLVAVQKAEDSKMRPFTVLVERWNGFFGVNLIGHQ